MVVKTRQGNFCGVIVMRMMNADEWFQTMLGFRHPNHSHYLGHYSSLWDGLLTDPRFMVLPIDDHGFHRGDAVFEAFKAVSGKVYLLREHLRRLTRSAAAIELTPPLSEDELARTILECAKALGRTEYLFRLYVTRGPGGFSANPYESAGSQVHLILNELIRPSESLYANGAKLGLSHVPMKEGVWPTIKSCNYLPNVLMKKEAVDRGVDFTVNVSSEGWLGEGSTENVFFVTDKGELVVPSFLRTLTGTTVARCLDWTSELISQGLLSEVSVRDASVQELKSAREILVAGTTLDIVPVTNFEGAAVADGRPGPVFRELRRQLLLDMQSGDRATPY